MVGHMERTEDNCRLVWRRRCRNSSSSSSLQGNLLAAASSAASTWLRFWLQPRVDCVIIRGSSSPRRSCICGVPWISHRPQKFFQILWLLPERSFWSNDWGRRLVLATFLLWTLHCIAGFCRHGCRRCWNLCLSSWQIEKENGMKSATTFARFVAF